MKKKSIKIVISLVTVILAVVHILCPKINIDIITIVLIALAIIPWLEPLFKSVELPGGLKFEFQDLQKVETDAKKAGLIKTEETKQQMEVLKNFTIYPFVEIARQNPNLALASLRIEIEKRLRELAAKYEIETTKYSIINLIKALSEKEILTKDETSSLKDMIDTLNRGVHGEDIDIRTSEWVIKNGPKIIDSLDNKIKHVGGRFSHSDPDAKVHWIDKSFQECRWVTNYEWDQCIKKHDGLWRKELENIYSALLKKITPSQQAKLIESQTNWEKQLEMEKEFYNSFENIPLKIGREGMRFAGINFMNKVRERTLELEEILRFLA